uniref:At4g15545-like C-terminal domain-containing protein n=1 Tax=Palpitomonas bilix TaxID=652834 RepID=A0A7S3CZB7_9EUKA|mmetsp:Transcript_15724/g.40000  ORF Transcript_15724/g.40000 Transcript_15724/m.40000 type:complete len:365 (+) Transcript_15724:145-1239(+)
MSSTMASSEAVFERAIELLRQSFHQKGQSEKAVISQLEMEVERLREENRRIAEQAQRESRRAMEAELALRQCRKEKEGIERLYRGLEERYKELSAQQQQWQNMRGNILTMMSTNGGGTGVSRAGASKTVSFDHLPPTGSGGGGEGGRGSGGSIVGDLNRGGDSPGLYNSLSEHMSAQTPQPRPPWGSSMRTGEGGAGQDYGRDIQDVLGGVSSSYHHHADSVVHTTSHLADAASTAGRASFSTAKLAMEDLGGSGGHSPTVSRVPQPPLTDEVNGITLSPPPPIGSLGPPLDPASYYRQVKQVLDEKQYGEFSSNLRLLNAGRQSLRDSMLHVKAIFGENRPFLYSQFLKLLRQSGFAVDEHQV